MIFFNKQSKVKLIKQENGRKPAHPEKNQVRVTDNNE